MRFKFVLILFLGISSFSLLGQNKIKWSDKGSGDGIYKLIKKGDDFFIIKSDLRKNLMVEKYNKDLKKILKKKIILKYDAKKKRLISILEKNDKVFFLLNLADKKKGDLGFFIDEFNLETCELVLQPKRIGLSDFSGKLRNERIRIDLSPDTSKIAILHRIYRGVKEKVSFKLFILDNKLEIISEHKFSFSYAKYDFILKQLHVDNSGVVTLAYMDNNNSPFVYRKVIEEEDGIKIPIDIEKGKQLKAFQLFQKDNDLISIGTYSVTSKRFSSRGILYCKYDAEEERFENYKYHEFSEKILEHDRNQFELRKAKERGESAEIFALTLRNIYGWNDKGILISMEEMESYRDRKYSADLNKGSDIILMNISFDGEKKWDRRIEKSGKSRALSSRKGRGYYSLLMEEDHIDCFYIHSPKSIKDGKIYKLRKGKRISETTIVSLGIVMAKIDKSGKVEGSVVYPTKSKISGFWFFSDEGKQKVIFNSKVGYRAQLGEFELNPN